MRDSTDGRLVMGHVWVCWFSLPRCDFSLSLFCNYLQMCALRRELS